ncbi:MAG: hypothetical protein ABGZ49_05350 [Akkermansiaceae bacterium]
MKPAFECATCTDLLATTAQEDHQAEQSEETGGGLRGPLLKSANLSEDWRMKFQ